MENEENQGVITVENEGGKGNPNHAPAGTPGGKGGQFVSGPQSDGGSNDDEMGTIELKETPKDSNSNLQSIIKEFISQKKEVENQKAMDFVDSVKGEITEENANAINNYSREQMLAFLSNSETGYDERRLKFATDAQLRALLYAEAVKAKRIQLEQKLTLIEKRKEEINAEITEKLNQYNIDSFSGMWLDTVHPSDYKFLKEKGSFEKKKQYYEDVLANADSPIDKKVKATQYLAKLNDFEKAGIEYEEAKLKFNNENIDELESLEKDSVLISEQIKNFQPDSELIKNADAFCSKFLDKNSAYSKERKNNAVWFKGFNEAYQHFSSNAGKHWKMMNSAEQNVIESYTGSGYSRFNKPLRKIYHDSDGYSFSPSAGLGMSTFSEAVNNLTNAIDKCEWEEDIWVNRYIKNNTKMFQLPGTSKPKELEYMTESELQSLVGTSFRDEGFMSAGAAKGTGYKTGNIVFNIYCPKGTKMAYVAPYSASSSSENEMIIQRGYEFRITKITHNGSHYYLDMEVVLGSDSKKPIGNDLKKIGNEYYYKPRGSSGEKYD